MLTVLTEPRRPRPRPSPPGISEARAIEDPPAYTVALGAFASGPAELESALQVMAEERGAPVCLCLSLTCAERLDSCGRLWPPYVGDLSRSGLLDPPLPALLRRLDEQARGDVPVGGPTIEERISGAFNVKR